MWKMKREARANENPLRIHEVTHGTAIKTNTVTTQPQGEGKTESDQTANKEGGARKESNLKLRRQPQRQTRRDTQRQGEG